MIVMIFVTQNFKTVQEYLGHKYHNDLMIVIFVTQNKMIVMLFVTQNFKTVQEFPTVSLDFTIICLLALKTYKKLPVNY